MGAHCHVVEDDGSLRLNRYGRPLIRTLLFPAEQATLIDTWNPIGLRGTASDSYSLDDVFVSEAFSTTREEPSCAARGGRSTPSHAGPLRRRRGGRRARHRASDARGFMTLHAQDPARLGRSRTMRSCRRTWPARRRARRGASLSAGYADDDPRARGRYRPHRLPDRARVRLACTHAIHGAIEVADYTYKAAGVDAIFPGSPFERRFRDIHTLSQQIQSRERALRGRGAGAARHAAGSLLLAVHLRLGSPRRLMSSIMSWRSGQSPDWTQAPKSASRTRPHIGKVDTCH